MPDFQILPSDFNATTVTFVAKTDAAKQRICGGISVDIRKSAAPDFLATLEAEGFKVEVN